MHERREIPSVLIRLADAQAGVLSREQVLGCGVSRHVLQRLRAADRWRLLDRGIYLTAPVEPSWQALAWAGVLIGGQDARLGARASGYLHKLLDSEPMPIDVLVPISRNARRQGYWRFARERDGARSPRSVGALPRLGVETAVLDLSASAPRGDVVALITTAVERRLTTPSRLAAAMSERNRQPHRRLITDLLADVEAGAESPLEVSYLTQVERPHGLPRGTRQQRRHGLPYVSDVGYDEYALLVELDGRLGHDGAGRFRDMNRDNRFALVSWTTLRYGWFDVAERPCDVATQVGAALVARGWAGLPTRCRRCVHRNG